MKQEMADHKPDIAYVPSAEFLRFGLRGDKYYRGFAINTSKFTGTTHFPSVLVVRKDDSAKSFADLEGAKYAYINRSCSSSYYPPAVILGQQGKKLDEYLDIIQTKPWQGQIDAVVSKEVRATMVAEDIWKTTAKNAEDTRVIGRYDNAIPAVIAVRHDLDEEIGKKLLAALVAWTPKWEPSTVHFAPTTMQTPKRITTISKVCLQVFNPSRVLYSVSTSRK